MKFGLVLLILCCVFFPLFSSDDAIAPSLSAYPNNPDAMEQKTHELAERLVLLFMKEDPEFRKQAEHLRQAKAKEAQAIPALLERDAALKALKRRLEAVQHELEAFQKEDARLQEVAVKRDEYLLLHKQFQEKLSSAPALREARENHARARAEQDAAFEKKLAASELPESVRLRWFRIALSAKFREGKKEDNPFAGFFDHLDAAPLNPAKFRTARRTDWKRIIASENPGVNSERLELLAKLRLGELEGTFPEAEAPRTKTESNAAEEMFRIINLQHKQKIDARETDRLLRRLRQRLLREHSFTRAEISSILYDLGENNTEALTNACRMDWRNVLKHAKLKAEDYDYVYNKIGFFSKTDWKELDVEFADRPLDPWMRSMIAAQAAVARAWDARGGGYADTVSEEGWKIFSRELGIARGELNKALQIAPERPQPYSLLLTVEMGSGTRSGLLEAFKKAIRLRPGYALAYNRVAFALLPRWCGSHRLILQLSDEAIQTERYDMLVPSAGFELIGRVVNDYPDYTWKNLYRRPELIVRMDKHFQHCLRESRNTGNRNFALMNKMLFEMASLRYDTALETRRSIDLPDDKLAEFWKKWSWRGGVNPDLVPRMPSYMNPVPLLRLFTEKYGKELQGLELEFLEGGQAGGTPCRKLAALIRSADLPKADKDTLIDLYGRWMLPEGGDSYHRNNTLLFHPFQVAMKKSDQKLIAELLELGFQYTTCENYPGETANIAAGRGVDPSLLDILKHAGDPLNRPEPTYGRIPIHIAAIRPNPIMLKKLLELGASPSARDGASHTPLHLAAFKGGAEVLRILIAAGADVDEQDKDGDTALMFVIQMKRTQPTWEQLVDHSKNLNVKNSTGKTALHFAAEHGADPKLVQRMLERGADPSLRGNDGKTPGDVARAKNNADLIPLLTK